MNYKVDMENEEFLYGLKLKDRKIIEKAISLYYDYLDVKEADKISKAIEDGTMKTYSAEEVRKMLGIASEN